MIRTQIQLSHQRHKELSALARERRVSMAELVREGVERVLATSTTDQWARARTVLGRYASGGRDGSRRHDAHLADAFR